VVHLLLDELDDDLVSLDLDVAFRGDYVAPQGVKPKSIVDTIHIEDEKLARSLSDCEANVSRRQLR
jgi:hypothetical protein